MATDAPQNTATDPGDDPLPSSRFRLLAWLSAAAFVVTGIAYVLVNRCLFADGTGFLYRQLLDRKVFNPVAYRYVSSCAQQVPMTLAMNVFHCWDLRRLTMLWGASLYALPMIGLGLSWFAVRNWNPLYFVFPLLSHAILFLNTGFCLFHESWTMTALYWVVLLMLLNPAGMNLPRMVLLLLFASLGTRTYESYMFLAVPLLAAVAFRWKRTRGEGNRWEPATLGLLIPIIVYGVVAAILEVRHPYDASNRQSFREAVWSHLDVAPVRFSLLLLLAVCVVLLFPRHRRVQFVAAVLCTLYGVFVFLTPWLFPGRIDPMGQYVARVQTIYVPFVLGAASLWIAAGPGRLVAPWSMEWKGDRSQEASKLLAGLTLLGVVVSAGFQIGCCWRWNHYLQVFRDDLRVRRGQIPFAESAVGREPAAGELDLRSYTWSWTMPQLSIFLSALDGHPVRAVVRTQIPGGWELFKPDQQADYPSLSKYGVIYDFAALLPNAAAPTAQPGDTADRSR